MSKALNFPDRVLSLGLVNSVVDDFPAKDTTVWTTTASDSGTAAVGDVVNGVVQLLPSDGTVADNDEVYLQTKELFKIAAGKPLMAGIYLQFTEAATNAANVMFGFMDAPTANAIVDNGAGPKTTFSGAVIYKVDGQNLWQCAYSDGAVQTFSGLLNVATALNRVAQTAGGAAWVKLEVEIIPTAGGLCDVAFTINDVCVFKMLDRTFANATEMALFVGAKNGSANQETINVDWIYGLQKR